MSDPIPPQDSSAQVELAPGVFVGESAIRFQYSRSSGPGGQNVNKVNTRAELWLRVDALLMLTDSARARLRTLAGRRWTAAGEIHLSADTERRQESNRQEVLARLRELLIQAMHEPKKRRKTKPSRAAKRRRVEGKRHRGEIKAGRRGGAES
jgi:ribosome-associated protein